MTTLQFCLVDKATGRTVRRDEPVECRSDQQIVFTADEYVVVPKGWESTDDERDDLLRRCILIMTLKNDVPYLHQKPMRPEATKITDLSGSWCTLLPVMGLNGSDCTSITLRPGDSIDCDGRSDRVLIESYSRNPRDETVLIASSDAENVAAGTCAAVIDGAVSGARDLTGNLTPASAAKQGVEETPPQVYSTARNQHSQAANSMPRLVDNAVSPSGGDKSVRGRKRRVVEADSEDEEILSPIKKPRLDTVSDRSLSAVPDEHDTESEKEEEEHDHKDEEKRSRAEVPSSAAPGEAAPPAAVMIPATTSEDGHERLSSNSKPKRVYSAKKTPARATNNKKDTPLQSTPSSGQKSSRISPSASANTPIGTTPSTTASNLSKIVLSSVEEDSIKRFKQLLSKNKIQIAKDVPNKKVNYVCIVPDGPLRKTPKVLRSLAMGKPVVTVDWLQACFEADDVIDHSIYQHEETLTEGEEVDRSTLFVGRRLWVTPGLAKTYGSGGMASLKALGHDAGASSVAIWSGKASPDCNEDIVLAIDENDADAVKLLEEHEDASVYHKDYISSCIVRGRREAGEMSRLRSKNSVSTVTEREEVKDAAKTKGKLKTLKGRKGSRLK